MRPRFKLPKTPALTKLTKLPVGTFVVFGDETPPEVHFIDERARRMLDDRERVTSRLKAVEYTFGAGMQYALPAHSLECMEFMGLQYEGPFQQQVRGICACIALGEPFNPDPDGGSAVPNPQPPPRKPSGTGATFKKDRALAS